MAEIENLIDAVFKEMEMRRPRDSCSICFWWEGRNCHFNPPTVVAEGHPNGYGTIVTRWPKTLPEDYCSRYLKRKEIPVNG